ncbi:hypothetical protein Tco_0215022 [Tanacetum coccineum]
MVFGIPFIDETGLTYNEEEGKVVFKQDDEKIMFKMLRTMKIFNQTRLMGLCTDSIPPSAYEENFSHGRTHYYQSLLIGDEYKQDNGDRRRIRYLMRLEKEMMGNKEEVTYFAFGIHLEELHVTWAHLEKKQTRLRTYTNIAQEFLYSDWRRRHQ